MSNEELVARYTELDERKKAIEDEQRIIKSKLADLGRGKHQIAGLTVTISNPARRFDLEAAWAVLSVDQKALAVSPDAKKVKEFLPPIVADSFMRETGGDPVVRIS